MNSMYLADLIPGHDSFFFGLIRDYYYLSLYRVVITLLLFPLRQMTLTKPEIVGSRTHIIITKYDDGDDLV